MPALLLLLLLEVRLTRSVRVGLGFGPRLGELAALVVRLARVLMEGAICWVPRAGGTRASCHDGDLR